MGEIMSRGILTAVITPFHNDKIDFKAFERHLQNQIDAGISGIIVSGSTGEAPVLSKDEKCELFRIAVEVVGDETEVIAGTGSYSTRDSIDLGKKAAQIGVDGLLNVVPYYNKPTQEGLYQHFKAIAAAVEPIPIYLYNVPGRTVRDLLPETVARLAEIENITHLKEASGSVARVRELVELAPTITLLSGDDKTFFEGVLHGMQGVISVASNLFPQAMVRLWRAYTADDVETATSINTILEPIYEFLFWEPNPMPVKAAAAHFGWIHNKLRLPLVPMSARYEAEMITLFEKTQTELEPYLD